MKRDLLLPVATLNTQKVLIDYSILACLPFLWILFSPSCQRVTAVDSCLLWVTWSIRWSQTTLCFAPVVCTEIVLSCESSCILSLSYQHFDLHEEEFVSFHDSVMNWVSNIQMSHLPDMISVMFLETYTLSDLCRQILRVWSLHLHQTHRREIALNVCPALLSVWFLLVRCARSSAVVGQYNVLPLETGCPVLTAKGEFSSAFSHLSYCLSNKIQFHVNILERRAHSSPYYFKDSFFLLY